MVTMTSTSFILVLLRITSLLKCNAFPVLVPKWQTSQGKQRNPNEFIQHNPLLYGKKTPARYFQIQNYNRNRISSNVALSAPNNVVDENEDDEALLESIEIPTLQNLCSQYKLSAEGTKIELLQRLRDYAKEQAELDQKRRQRRQERVAAGSVGKERHTILEDGLDDNEEKDDNEDELAGFFYFSVPENKSDKNKKAEKEMNIQKSLQQNQQSKNNSMQSINQSSARITAPPPPADVKPNEKGERVVTIYSTTDNNDMTSMTSTFSGDPTSINDIGYQKPTKSSNTNNGLPQDSLLTGPFNDASGISRRRMRGSRSEDDEPLEQVKEKLRELLGNLLATTGAPAFQEDYFEQEDSPDGMINNDNGASNGFTYGFTGFNPERIPPELLSGCSLELRFRNGKALQEVLSEFELDAIGHDGMAADDISKGGGHYKEVTKVGAFLEGFRKAEERRIARLTTTMLLDCLVKEGVVGLDKMLSNMQREGDATYEDTNGEQSAGLGELNDALLRYLEDAIRQQEQRVGQEQQSSKNGIKNIPHDSLNDSNKDDLDLVWNVTRGEDGVMIETLDPNNPVVGKILKDELQKEKQNEMIQEDSLSSMTVQEKMLLLLKLLRDRVKVEAVIGNDSHATNLKILAYCLKSGDDEAIQQLVMEQFGMSLDALDNFSELVASSIDYAKAQQINENVFLDKSSQKKSTLLNVAKLQKIRTIAEKIKVNGKPKSQGRSPLQP